MKQIRENLVAEGPPVNERKTGREIWEDPPGDWVYLEMSGLMCFLLADTRNQAYETGYGKECSLVPWRWQRTWRRLRKPPVPSGGEGRGSQKLRVLVVIPGISWQGARWPWGWQLEGQSAPTPEPPSPARTKPEAPLEENVSGQSPARRHKPYCLFIQERSCYNKSLTRWLEMPKGNSKVSCKQQVQEEPQFLTAKRTGKRLKQLGQVTGRVTATAS